MKRRSEKSERVKTIVNVGQTEETKWLQRGKNKSKEE